MKIRIWTFGALVHQINSLYEVRKLKQNLRKNKVVTGKTPFFVIGPFCTPHSICYLISASDRDVLYGNVVFSILALQYSRFLEKVCVFQEICFQ